jgi:hypothetical protein
MHPFDNAAVAAFGGASVAYPGTSDGFSNPAQLGLKPSQGISAGSAIPYGIGGWKTGEASVSGKSGFGLLFNYSGTEYYKEERFSLAYGRKLSDHLLLGITASAAHVNAGEYGSSTAPDVEIGFLTHPLAQIWLGGAIRNPFQQKLEGINLPTFFRLGACWQPSNLFLMLAETEKDLDRPAQVKAGFEYRPGDKTVVLRAGIRTNPSRAAFGAGLRLKSGLRLDVSSEWHPVLGITPAVMVSWRKG